jgi:hypothetical protein
MLFRKLILDLIKGVILSLLYFEITKANDTTMNNVVLFTSFYLSMVYGATVTGIDPNVITSAFLTKTVFTLVDERIKRKDDNDSETNNKTNNKTT